MTFSRINRSRHSQPHPTTARGRCRWILLLSCPPRQASCGQQRRQARRHQTWSCKNFEIGFQSVVLGSTWLRGSAAPRKTENRLKMRSEKRARWTCVLLDRVKNRISNLTMKTPCISVVSDANSGRIKYRNLFHLPYGSRVDCTRFP